MSGSPPFVTWAIDAVAFAALVTNVVVFIVNVRRLRRPQAPPEVRGRCPVCERMRRDHTVQDLESCLLRAQEEAAKDGRFVLPVQCPTCRTSGHLAGAATCGGCGKPMLIGEIARVS